MNAVRNVKQLSQIARQASSKPWVGGCLVLTLSYSIRMKIIKRARHAVLENQRTLKLVRLEEGNLEAFGRFMNASHVSRERL